MNCFSCQTLLTQFAFEWRETFVEFNILSVLIQVKFKKEHKLIKLSSKNLSSGEIVWQISCTLPMVLDWVINSKLNLLFR
jgi:hypothetical protein